MSHFDQSKSFTFMSKYLKKCKFLNMIDNTVSRAKFDRKYDFNG